MALDLHFGPSGAGGGGSSDYVKDAFDDISLAATNNTGLSSTILTNPLSQNLSNTDAPQFGSKTLYIEDLEILEDRSAWINNKPTFKIKWSEDYPGAFGYVYGDIRLRNKMTGHGKYIEVRNVNDGVGVTGVFRNVMWIVQPNQLATATATRVLDSVSGSTIDFSAASLSIFGGGDVKSNYYVHSTSNNDENIHDYRLVANQVQTLEIAGVLVLAENSGNNIKCNPGVTYVDKTKVISTEGATLAYPVPNVRVGGKSAVYKTSSNTYGVTTNSLIDLSTIATGSSGTNSITITAGEGASFAAGMGVVSFFGTSAYVGSIFSVSTDTFTVGPTLPIGVSGTLYRAWYAGATVSIDANLFKPSFDFDPGIASNPVNPLSFGATISGDFMYSDPQKRYRAWGDQLLYSSIDGYNVVAFNGATTGFFQVDGYFQAADIEWVGLGTSSVLHGTFSINGCVSWGQNQGFTSLLKQTVFTDAAPGWNSFRFDVGASFFQVGIKSVNFYEAKAPGVSFGLLAEFNTLGATALRHGNAVNASFMVINTFQRFYADDLYFKGDWARGTTHVAAGGVRFAGASTNSVLNFQYYGKDFALVGTAGGSGIFTLDGASFGQTFNQMLSVATLGFHTLSYTYQAGATALIEAIDIMRPRGEVVNKQKFVPRAELLQVPKVFTQGNTPQNPKDGDLWAQQPLTQGNTPLIWVRLFGLWHQITVTSVTDDPQAQEFYKAMGGNTNAQASASSDLEKFNFVSWSQLSSGSSVRYYQSTSDSTLFNLVLSLNGVNSVLNTATTINQAFNKASWASITANGTGVCGTSTAQAFGNVYMNQGTIDITSFPNNQTQCVRFNNVAWSTMTAWGSPYAVTLSFFANSLVSSVNGANTGGGSVLTHQTRSAADSVANSTDHPTGGQSNGGSAGLNGTGVAHNSNGSNLNASYVWNGSAWSSAISCPVAKSNLFAAFASGRNLAITSGGIIAASAFNSTAIFNGTSYTASTASILSRAFGAGGSCV